MASAVLGYVVVYFVIVGYGAIQKSFIDRIPYGPVIIVGLILTLAMAYRNHPLVHRGPIRLANFVAEQTVAGVEESDWLVSSSFMNSLLVTKAAQKGWNLSLINVAAGQAEPYKRYLADQLESSRYRSLLQAGIFPLIQEMITDQVTGYPHVLTYNLPQLFRQNGMISVPHGAFYSAVKNGSSIDLGKLFAGQTLFMEEFRKRSGWIDKQKISPTYLPSLREQLSQNANNLGVLAWEQDRPALAEKAFNWALEISPVNPSALLNRVSLGPDLASGAFDRYRQKLQEYVESNQKKYHLWDLSSRHGYVIDPEAFAQEGLTWALSGSIERSMGALQKAKARIGERSDLQWLLSNLYAAQGDVAASRKELESLLLNDSTRPKAIFGLARLEIREGRWIEARKQLDLLKPLAGWRHSAEIELALLTALEGRPEEAQKALLEITRLKSDDTRGWLALAAVSVDLENAEEVLEVAITKVMESKVGNVTEALQFARLLASRGDYETAVKVLAPAVTSQPMNVSLLEFMVQLDKLNRDIKGARVHVERLLTLDSRNAIGNRMMGSLQIHDGHHALAESSLRVSMDSEAHPDAGADLAWLLQRRGEYTEALDLANRVMALNDQNPSALHTRGLIYYRLERFEEAKQDLLKALGIWIEDPFARLYLAMVYAATGEFDKARDLMDVLEPIRLRLPQELQDEMGRVNKNIIEKSTSL
jgi:Flp pilus assembly protein TadD